MRTPIANIVGCLFFLLLIVYVADQDRHVIPLFFKSETAHGIIVGRKGASHRKHDIVQFHTRTGEQYQFTSKLSNGGIASLFADVGSKVNVMYDPTHPEHAEINNFYTISLAIILFVIAPLGLLIRIGFEIRKLIARKRTAE
jgi:hypothetical protein